MQAARRQLLALCPTTLRALNGVQLTEDETRLVSLKHRQDSGSAAALAAAPASALHRAPWRRRRSTLSERPATAAPALPIGAVTGRGTASGKRPAAGAGAGRAGTVAAHPAACRGVGKGPGSPGVEWKDARSVVMQGDAVAVLKVRRGFRLGCASCATSLVILLRRKYPIGIS